MEDTPFGQVAKALVWCCFAVAIFAILWIGMSQLPWGVIAGGKSPAEVFALLLGPLGALAAIFALYLNFRTADRTFRLTLRGQRLSTFQKGAEMLNEASEPSSNAGVAVLRSVAEEDPAFTDAVCAALASFATATERTKWQGSLADFATMGPHDIVGSSPAAMRAVEAVSLLHFPRLGPLGYPINRPYFASYEYNDGRFGALSMRNARFHHVVFNGCFFTRTRVSGRVGQALIFTNCYFSGANFTLHGLDDKPIQPEESDRVAFVNANEFEGFAVNEIPFTEWQRRAPPPPLRDLEGRTVVN
jgi:hypothetical protein